MSGRRPRSRRPTRRALVVYAVLAALAVYVLVRNLDSPNDYLNFVAFGRAALAGLNPYLPEVVEQFGRGGLWSTWPPGFAPVAVLLARGDALLGRAPTIFLWQGANLAALACILAVCARWLYDRRLALRPGRDDPRELPLWTAAALAGLVVPARLVLSNFEHSQSNLLILGLAMAGFELFRRRRRWAGGLAVGLATAFKATPVLLLPYLAWRGRWRDLGASAAGMAVAWGLLPALVAGPGGLARWYGGWLAFVGGIEVPVSPMNQSLQGLLTRLLPAGGGGGAVGPEAGGPLGAAGAGTAVVVVGAALALAAALAFGRPGRDVPERREALELGVAFAAMGLFSPIGWKSHFVGLVPLAAALWARTPAAARWVRGPAKPLPAGTRASRVLYGGLAAAALLVNGTATGLVGPEAGDWFEHWGVVTGPAVALTLLALWVLWREARPGTGQNVGRARAVGDGG